MAADLELRLISRAIRDRNLLPLLEVGVTDEWFNSDDGGQLWRFATDHYSRYGECPTAVLVRDALPNYRLLRVDDSLAALVDKFVAWRRYDLGITMLQTAGDLFEDNKHEEALSHLSAELLKLNLSTDQSSRDRNLAHEPSIDPTIDRYLELRGLENHMRGVPTGFPTIDRATSGLQEQQLVTIIAPPKVGKSTLALAIARNVHDLAHRNVLFVTFEMSADEQEARYLAMVGKISHTSLTTGDVNPEQERQLRQRMHATVGHGAFILSDAPSANTISGLTAKIEKHKPDVCFVDGVYLMVDEVTKESNTPAALTNITRSMKRLAQRFEIPIVLSTQVLLWKMRGGRVTSDAIGYSSSFMQDSDVLLALQAVEDRPDRRILRVEDSRNCPKVTVNLDWDWQTTSFTEETFNVGGTTVAPSDGDEDPDDE